MSASGEKFQKMWLQICYSEAAQQKQPLCLGYKVHPLIYHFNAAFVEALSLDSEKSIDGHLTTLRENIAASNISN